MMVNKNVGLLEKFARLNGCKVYYDPSTVSNILVLEDGTEHRLNYYDINARSEQELVAYLIDLMTRKQITEAETFLLNADNSPTKLRVMEINKELDILRGVTPTPRGYVINIERTKELMKELKDLLAIQR